MIRVCTLFSGSSGNCEYVNCNDTSILVDAGVSGKKIENALYEVDVSPEEIDAIVISHEHIDHIRGVGVLARKYGYDIYATQLTWQEMYRQVGDIPKEQIHTFVSGGDIVIGDINISTFKTPHDAADPVGFNIFAEGKKITIATDIGYVDDEILERFKDSNIALIEANHDINMLKAGPYPYELKKRILGERGHLSNERAGEVVAELAKSGTQNILLGHLSKENNFPELAYETVLNALEGIDTECVIEVAKRDSVGRMVMIS